jgi:hypothetical protein
MFAQSEVGIAHAKAVIIFSLHKQLLMFILSQIPSLTIS